MEAIIAALDQLELGSPITAANLTMYPLIMPAESAPGYLTLDEALATGLASITEISESGSVPELLVKNGAAKPVLILDGEELVGAKQNRIVNLTILVAAQQTLHIPVSCVEAGRWARRSREFAAAGRAHYATGRARKVSSLENRQTSGAVRPRRAPVNLHRDGCTETWSCARHAGRLTSPHGRTHCSTSGARRVHRVH